MRSLEQLALMLLDPNVGRKGIKSFAPGAAPSAKGQH